jgi:hypothetical protein
MNKSTARWCCRGLTGTKKKHYIYIYNTKKCFRRKIITLKAARLVRVAEYLDPHDSIPFFFIIN